MLIDTQKISGSTDSGSFSDNTNSIRGLIKQIIVNPNTETTTYNISILNTNGIEIYSRTSETGSIAELTDIPINGICTISITSATADELFNIYLITME